MSSLRKEIVFLILQFLDEEKYKETVHRLELESNFYFNMSYFEELVINGKWDKVEEYISGFTKVEDDKYSLKIFFEIRKQKFLEALEKLDRGKAMEILVNDLKVFESYHEDIFKDFTQLLTKDDFSINEKISKQGEAKSGRGFTFGEIKKLIEANPLFHDKLQFPVLESSKLKTIINESLNQHHKLSEKAKPSPDTTRSQLLDSNCNQPNCAQAPSPFANPLMGGASSSRGVIQSEQGSLPNTRSSWMASPRSAFSPVIKRPPRYPTDNRIADSDHGSKRLKSFEAYEQISNTLVNTLSPDDLPVRVVMTLPHCSPITSIDFHPIQQLLLLVGTIGGDVSLWNLGARKKITEKNFNVWNLAACSNELQTSLKVDGTMIVNHVAWSPDGLLFGVAYSKSIVHMYYIPRDSDIHNHLEIEAHKGSVNHLAFSHPDKHLSFVTCGDDRLIKVWDAATGTQQFTFEGHEAPVFSVCPHYMGNVQFVFSTSVDGKIKAWLYDDNMGPKFDHVAPGYSSTRMAYTCDGNRLFSCGTNKEGESFLVEWDESEGSKKREYLGLGKLALGIVQFDTIKNRFLVVGDESTIKIWDMDNSNILTTIPADGGLSASPCVRVSKEGILLAVSTNDYGVRILATNDGIRLLKKAGKCIVAPTHDMMPRIADNSRERSNTWKVTEITEPSQCFSLRLDDNVKATKISRLIYTSSGSGVLALQSNAVHKFWKWHKTDSNLVGMATTCAQPVLWQPTSGILMTNDINVTNPKDVIPCFALSKNDLYVVSSSGGKISLFHLPTFETKAKFMAPPPAATFLAFYPLDNNIIAIGMEDSSINIYNIRTNEVKAKLNGHQKRITGLAFSEALNILVSSGDDLQICIWSTNGWEKKCNKYLQDSNGKSITLASETGVQFHKDQIHLLVVHETQLAIFYAKKLEYLKQWFRTKATGPITSAAYSCDSESIFVSFENGSVEVLVASNLRLRCKIDPTAYLPSNLSSKVYPLVIAAHPSKTNQFALGLSNGCVYVLEPFETEGKWGIPPAEN